MSDDRPAGPPSLVEQPPFLTVARVIRAHGLAGELSCEIVTEFPQRFRRAKTLYLAAPGATQGPPRACAVRGARVVPRGPGQALILSLEGVDDRVAADGLRGSLVQVPVGDAWKLPEGRYYWHQIVGLRAVTPDGGELGTVRDILETGANDVYVVRGEHGELLVPAIREVVKEISPERGVMVVELLPGMGHVG